MGGFWVLSLFLWGLCVQRKTLYYAVDTAQLNSMNEKNWKYVN